MSRGFLSALAGIGMTLLAWFGPWAWPAWPAFTLIDLVFGSDVAFAELPFATRAASVAMLILVNVSFWALVFRSAAALREVAIRKIRHDVRDSRR